jgi:hypothetical protein
MTKNFSSLPEGLPPEEIDSLVNELCNEYQQRQIGSLLFLRASYELANRQWATYQKLAPPTMQKVEEIILSILNEENTYADVEMRRFFNRILSIIGNFGLVKCYEKIKDLYFSKRVPIEIEFKIVKFIREVDQFKAGTVEDPYKMLK